MSRIDMLEKNYKKFIGLPWRKVSSDQRVIFCVYDPGDEMSLRYNMIVFKNATEDAGHDWIECNLIYCFEEWMGKQKYAEAYFKEPEKLLHMPSKFKDFIFDKFKEQTTCATKDSVIAIMGIGSMFGFITIKEFIEDLAAIVDSRIVVFFPGSYSSSPSSNYRLLNAYDSWDYLATPITSDTENF